MHCKGKRPRSQSAVATAAELQLDLITQMHSTALPYSSTEDGIYGDTDSDIDPMDISATPAAAVAVAAANAAAEVASQQYIANDICTTAFSNPVRCSSPRQTDSTLQQPHQNKCSLTDLHTDSTAVEDQDHYIFSNQRQRKSDSVRNLQRLPEHPKLHTKRLKSNNSSSSSHSHGRSCANCGCTETVQWRRDISNPDRTLCNACGMCRIRYGRNRKAGGERPRCMGLKEGRSKKHCLRQQRSQHQVPLPDQQQQQQQPVAIDDEHQQHQQQRQEHIAALPQQQQQHASTVPVQQHQVQVATADMQQQQQEVSYMEQKQLEQQHIAMLKQEEQQDLEPPPILQQQQQLGVTVKQEEQEQHIQQHEHAAQTAPQEQQQHQQHAVSPHLQDTELQPYSVPPLQEQQQQHAASSHLQDTELQPYSVPPLQEQQQSTPTHQQQQQPQAQQQSQQPVLMMQPLLLVSNGMCGFVPLVAATSAPPAAPHQQPDAPAAAVPAAVPAAPAAPAAPVRRRRTAAAADPDGKPRICANCGTSRGLQWRRDKHDYNRLLCNACGLYKNNTGLDRPTSYWQTANSSPAAPVMHALALLLPEAYRQQQQQRQIVHHHSDSSTATVQQQHVAEPMLGIGNVVAEHSIFDDDDFQVEAEEFSGGNEALQTCGIDIVAAAAAVSEQAARNRWQVMDTKLQPEAQQQQQQQQHSKPPTPPDTPLPQQCSLQQEGVEAKQQHQHQQQHVLARELQRLHDMEAELRELQRQLRI